jgi:hypothetical protein
VRVLAARKRDGLRHRGQGVQVGLGAGVVATPLHEKPLPVDLEDPPTAPEGPGGRHTEGRQSPLFGHQTQGSDPLLAFNTDGDPYAAGLAFSEAKPNNSRIYVLILIADFIVAM